MSKYTLSESLVYTIPVWFLKINEFIRSARNEKYSSRLHIKFPVPIFEEQNHIYHRYLFVFILIVLNHLSYFDSMTFNNLITLVLKPILSMARVCFAGNKLNQILAMDLCIHIHSTPPKTLSTQSTFFMLRCKI